MDYRETIEENEKKVLASYATFSTNSKGRLRQEEECSIRTCFQKDRDRILHSKAFRRLKHKTQVFISPEGDHYRTRLTHTLEVAQLSRTVARALNLNEDLTEAIALGHDLGHTPFGHAGEAVLDKLVPGGFHHNFQSLRVVDYLERPGGLNLTQEVRDGIENHTGDKAPFTLEGRIVKICDRIAYINHDIDDAIRGEIISQSDLPYDSLEILGFTSNSRINSMIFDLITTSKESKDIKMSDGIRETVNRLRKFLFRKVYIGSEAKEEESKAMFVIESVYDYFRKNHDKLPVDVQTLLDTIPLERVVCDYVAGMTDRYILDLYRDIFLPKPWSFRREE
ncbi:deoxyguanosinetriphosphate triphosphohydrolase [Natranaerobius trueperi]|uniref:Deoxyguanosinetriphosphate triphosphohydrolase-like protein n=1 Tax=Natranaerobius trueperi TaxID=759412 RepID=A0A226BVQ7_9FIRM|nr:deoxyguanosinetriphosphate triphosphohydrolase [Natranaerobius trueperi]OWZ83076.1 deoxyguanosinetriphosphate triphosphohydrolase [Natranaerobius trueperi]